VFALALVVVLALTGCGGSGGPLSSSALAKQSEAVRSLAAEGALLAADAAAGRSTSVFLREHASELEKAAGTIDTSLATATTARDRRPQLVHLRRVAKVVHGDLGRLPRVGSRGLPALVRALQQAADDSEKIGHELG
jgi:hypothetical protein